MRDYKVEDIFQDIDGDPDNVLMTIPPEIMTAMGWSEGTNIRVQTEDGRITITEVKDGEE